MGMFRTPSDKFVFCLSKDKGVFRASTIAPKYTVRQCRSTNIKGVTFFRKCY